MSLLIESIKLLNGEFYNLFYHEQRMNQSLRALCGSEEHFYLEEFLNRLQKPPNGFYKCRLVYDETTTDVEFIPYVPKKVESLRIIEHDRIRYDFKFADRKNIDRLFALRQDCDDILIVKEGKVTDTSFSNVIFCREKKWYTPWSALLKGTMRQNLLDRNKIYEEEITIKDISSFETFKIINAMVGFDSPESDVSHIVL